MQVALPKGSTLSPLYPKIAVSSERLVSVLFVLLFSICLIYVYKIWLSPTYFYLGFPIYSAGGYQVTISTMLVILTASALPLEINKFSDFFLWMVLYFIYIPAMMFVPLQGLLADGGLTFILALTVSFNTMRIMAKNKIEISLLRVARKAFVPTFFFVYAILNFYVLSIYGNNLRLVDFSDVYDQRSSSAELAIGSLVGYATGVLSGAFNPFLIAVGLTERRRLWIFIGIAGQILIYAATAPKFVLVSAILAPVFYTFLIRRIHVMSSRLGLLVAGSCLVPLLLMPVLNETSEGVLWQIVSLIFMRTYGMAGALSGIYADFFSQNPYTYFSHVNIVSLFVAFPYDLSIGQEIGYSMVGAPLNANANFWATDGLASAGNIGVVIVGFFVGFGLIVLNSLFRRICLRLSLVAFIPLIMMISNSSIFTTLFTGGGCVLVVMLYLWQVELLTKDGSRDREVGLGNAAKSKSA